MIHLIPLPLKLLQKKKSLWLWFLLLSTFLFFMVLASSFKSENEAAVKARENFLYDLTAFQRQTEKFTRSIELLKTKEIPVSQVQEEFYKVKNNYKQVEYLLEYLDPELAKSLNGAPIPKVLVEEAEYQTLPFLPPGFRTFPPEGLQVLEELIFAEDFNYEKGNEALVHAYSLEEKVLLFTNNLKKQSLTDKQILESLREQLIRTMTMGITGFDAPAAGKELEFVTTSLKPVLAATQLYKNTTAQEAKKQSTMAANTLEKAVKYLQEYPDFDTFDRLFFIREFADPAYGALTALQQELIPESPSASKAVNSFARSLFSSRFLQTAYYAKQDRQEQNKELVELGKLLFFDPVLSENNQRSCASCHKPSKAFTDGMTRSLAFDFKGSLQRNAPTLLNAVYSNAYFYDSRSQYLQDQIPVVVLKADELHGSYEEVVAKLEHSREYKRMFKRAFKEQLDNKISVNTINRAIAAYVQNLTALNTPFDQYMRRENELLGDAAKRGFNLFMGKAACATCHFAPVFNGTVPPRYTESETEVLGVTKSADFAHPTLDEDPGRAGVIPADAWKHSFKTPTVRNIALTAPYMHNGALTSLKEVMDFYDSGGGAGMGLDVPNQTLPADRLNLTEEEKDDIIAFMQSLTDTTTTYSAPESLPKFTSGKKELNDRKTGGAY